AADSGFRARLRPAAVTAFAGHGGWDLDLHLLAAIGLFEGDFKIVAKIGAARGPGAACATHKIAKEIFENIAEAAGAKSAEASRAGPGAIFEGGMAVLVIGTALLWVFQDFVSFVDFLEGSL